jgi:hypothetical protein
LNVFGIESLGGNERAAVLIGIILVEALALYVGFGGLEALVGPSIRRVLEGRCPVSDLLFGRCTPTDGEGTER